MPACSEMRPEESGRGRLRVRATSLRARFLLDRPTPPASYSYQESMGTREGFRMRRWLARFPRRLQALIHRSKLDNDLADELRFHREMLEQESGGRAEAARRFGNQTLLQETSRELFSFVWLETVWRDLRYGARSLR